MEEEVQALKDELARVRAREKRYKDSTDAEIAVLREQLEGMQRAAANGSTAMAVLESRYQEQDAENAKLRNRIELLQAQVESLLGAQSHVEDQKSQLENRCALCEEENAKLQRQILSSATELEKLKHHCQKLESDYTSSHELGQLLEGAGTIVEGVTEKFPGLDEILATADFLKNNKPDIHELLEIEGYSLLSDISLFVMRCSDKKVLVTLWKCIHKMVENGANPDVAKKCLLGILRWYNLGNKTQLKTLEQEQGIFSLLRIIQGQKTPLLPGLAEVYGQPHVHVLFKSETEPN